MNKPTLVVQEDGWNDVQIQTIENVPRDWYHLILSSEGEIRVKLARRFERNETTNNRN